ncbi:hypothetical protein ANANG_G00240050 [Anguilla anguilla]|uniref:START domain-containing protein n=1 Tax=Anguilla anguilla TaxID=7936 RepID=A0A9D3LUZ1_ANGAN|nr:hypothetical protein ANANG_G00240050 [Anguilla anguilla]
MVTQSRNSYVDADLHPPTLEELCKQLEEDDGSYLTHTDGLVQGLLKEARDRSKGWVSRPSTDSTELSYKKVGDGNPCGAGGFRWSRDFVVLRSWRTDLPKGTCALVSVSVDHEESPPLGGVRAVVLESQYLLEPCGSGKSRLTHICRVDLKGRTPEWYNKAFGHLCAAEVARIRNSFHPLTSEGPETKI